MIDWNTESMILNNNAHKKELTSKPPTMKSHNKITIALITNRKSPKVTNVTGSVNRTRIGLTNKFNNDSTTATMTEVKKLSTVTPGIKWEISITSSAVRRMRMIKFMS
jgi:hypothetical protein